MARRSVRFQTAVALALMLSACGTLAGSEDPPVAVTHEGPAGIGDGAGTTSSFQDSGGCLTFTDRSTGVVYLPVIPAEYVRGDGRIEVDGQVVELGDDVSIGGGINEGSGLVRPEGCSDVSLVWTVSTITRP